MPAATLAKFATALVGVIVAVTAFAANVVIGSVVECTVAAAVVPVVVIPVVKTFEDLFDLDLRFKFVRSM